ncbi:alpha/beta fold hydrolase [Gulosibacter chungangensis]|uniref:Alpha/beta hydrolase n=1 Tax=Gulosibacter chungangensis TaxID=979746 RepID=A0A7J5B7Y6_9MICO|nr:alpha/beta hydrolase [Gulosibacter chungangensis]KAB1641189.1 hypothetical protein F8O05_13240 [Gulosibacter chungangensis]
MPSISLPFRLLRRVASIGRGMRHSREVLRPATANSPAFNLAYVRTGPLIRERLRHRRSLAWQVLELYATRGVSIARCRGIYEFDLVGTIGFRELGCGGTLDGLPLDPALTYAPLADQYPGFAAEPYDLTAAAARFDWPVLLLAGDRDLRTPIEIARRVEQAAPDAVLVEITNGHSALDFHPMAFLNALRQLVRGQHAKLSGQGARLSALPKRGGAAVWLPRLLAALLKLETALLR